MRNSIIKYILFLALIALQINFVGCKKFVETNAPDTQANGDNVYTNDATAIAVLTGMYTRIAQGSPGPNFSSGTRSFSLLCGLSADEYTLFTGADPEMSGFYQNALIANLTTNIGTDYWTVLYDHVYYANSAIEGLTNATQLTPSVKQQLLGEAKFMRAFFYFYLVNLYGDVPLVISTNYKTNAVLPRTPIADVYKQIIIDIQDAENLLSADYLDGKLQKYSGIAERVRPTKWTAAGLLSRVSLYNGNLTGDANNYINAEVQATMVINNASLYDTTSLNSVFLKNSKEAIWQLQVVNSNQNTDDSRMFIVTGSFSSSTPVWLNDTLLKSFEPGDLRRVNGNWVSSATISGIPYYFPYKYKNNTGSVTEYLMVMRLAEQYLIRAEARAQQGNFGGSQSDLNLIRKRAGLSTTTASDKNSLLKAILHERQIEFFSEWGHRWFDLKRTNNLDALMAIITPRKANRAPWRTYQKLYPLPFNELLGDANLIQNSGY